MRLGEADKETEELLVSDVQVVAARVAATVDHRPCLDALAVRQHDAARGDLRHLGLESHPISQRRGDDLVQTLRGHRVVAVVHGAMPVWEAQLVARPTVGDEWFDPPPLVRGQIRVVKGPRVVGAEGGPALDDEQREVRTLHENPVGDQAVGETAADKNQLRLHEPSEAASAPDGSTEESGDAIPRIGLRGRAGAWFTIYSSRPTVAMQR